MPSTLTHALVPVAMAVAAGRGRISPRLLAAGIAAAVVPDVDFLGRWVGIPYAGDFGHRGVTHSLCFAALLGAIAAQAATRLRAAPALAFGYVFLACASHGLLDMATHGGLGITYFWPFSADRLFLPWRPLMSLPRTVGDFLHGQGAVVLRAEARWVWLPCFALAFAIRLRRSRP